MKKIVLFESKEQCCGCGLCATVCSKKAITMEPDERGFVYPRINSDKCIGCGACNRVCGYQSNVEKQSPLQVYAAVTTNTNILDSASGGAFSSIAKTFIDEGGIVAGSAMTNENNKLVVKHILISDSKDLNLIQGSKYVQSKFDHICPEIKKNLEEGKKILFSGTPCQTACLKKYLGKEYSGLYIADIICHGVPSGELFDDYIKSLNLKYGKILDFKFRDKKRGWKLTAKITYVDKKGKIAEKLIPCKASAYYYYFLKGEIYRDNCYSCQYACQERVGDITLGDFWGIRDVHPEMMNDEFSEDKGISCILVNNEKGQELLKEYGAGLYLKESTFENASAQNGQLLHPSTHSDERKIIFDLYMSDGYDAIEKYFRKKIGIGYYIEIIKNQIPIPVKKFIKKAVKKGR